MFEKWNNKKTEEKEKWLQKANDIVCFMNDIIVNDSLPLHSSEPDSIPIGALRVKFVEDYNAPIGSITVSSKVQQTGEFGYSLQQFTQEGWVNKRLIKSDSDFTEEAELNALILMLRGLQLLKNS